jgi:hypothetical protein
MTGRWTALISTVAFSSLVLAIATFVLVWTKLRAVDKQLITLNEKFDNAQVLAANTQPFMMVSPLPDNDQDLEILTSDSMTVASAPASLEVISESITDLRKVLIDVTRRLDQVETKLKQGTTQTSKTNSIAREYTIFLGSGNTNNRDWTVIPGAGVTLDISKYKNVRSVRFEAGLSIISGEAHARLYEQTGPTTFYSTEVYNNTSAGEWETSTPVTLPPGERYYTVQLRSSNGEMANLIGSRIKIWAD